MLSVYAAWTEGAVEADITAIRDAMNRKGGGGARRKTAADGPGTETPTSTMVGLATSRPAGQKDASTSNRIARDDFPAGRRFGSSRQTRSRKPLETKENIGGKGGTRTLDPGIMRAVRRLNSL